MKKHNILQFNDVMDIYDVIPIKGKEFRLKSSLTITPETVAERLKEAIKLSEQLIWKKPSKGIHLPVVKPEGLVILKLRGGSFQDIADASKILMEAKYDLKKLLTLAKRARVDKMLIRLMKRLGMTGGGLF